MKRHLRRLSAPKRWNILRKTNTFLLRPNPGAHGLEQGLPLGVLLRDYLGYAKSLPEVRHILRTKGLLVDNEKRTDPKYSIGLMDVLAIKDAKEYYRILLNQRGLLTAVKISEKEAGLKPKKIINKTKVKGNRIQLNFFDGTNLLVAQDSYKVGDTALIEFPFTIVKSFSLVPGAIIYLTGGKHIGDTGTVEKIEGQDILYKSKGGGKYLTQKSHVFVVGDKQPCINLGESS